jgi:benzoyl-CoA reductase subunit A
MVQEFGKWPESSWVSNQIDPRKATQLTAGIDVGTTSTQAVVMADGKICGSASIRTGSDFKAATNAVIEKALDSSGLKASDIGSIMATGFGSRNVGYATGTTDEIHAHAKGARYMFGSGVTTVVDLGGQTVKAVRLFDWDRVRDFKTSDKCATGFGRHIEVVAELLREPITEMGEKSLTVEHDPEPVSTTCCNFAFPETIGLFRQGYKEDTYSSADVLASYLFTIAWRALGTIGKLCPLDVGDINVYGGLAFTGGLAKNAGITRRIERELNAKALASEYDPQLAGAIGAALLA